MKRIVLRLLYNRYRAFFYGFFVEEMIAEIPAKLSVPALSFLANGKEKLEQWVLYWINLIQQRIVTDKRDIEVQQGMILAFKIFLNLVRKQTPPQARIVGEVKKEEKVDLSSQVEEAISNLKKKSKEKKEEAE